MPALRTRLRTRPVAIAALALVATLVGPTAAQAAPHHAPARPAAHHAPAHAPSAAASKPAPYAVRTIDVPRRSVSGFGGGTIFEPQGTGKRVLGSVVVAPGLGEGKAEMEWYGTDLAAQGFVVLTIDMLDGGETPDLRAPQSLAAADYLTGSSPVKAEVSPSRMALLGYSFGGGGTLQAAQSRPSIKAAVALAPVDLGPATNPTSTPAYPQLKTPTLIVTGRHDVFGVPSTMGKPAYDSIPASTPKQYLELRDADHDTFSRHRDGTLRVAITAFLKRYLDDNSAYAPFICPAPKATGPISVSVSSCGARRAG
jgi:dienelactone hydrolase